MNLALIPHNIRSYFAHILEAILLIFLRKKSAFAGKYIDCLYLHTQTTQLIIYSKCMLTIFPYLAFYIPSRILPLIRKMAVLYNS
jgi:hypothetical protein